jgi:SNF2 family DNA or RNA helicase
METHELMQLLRNQVEMNRVQMDPEERIAGDRLYHQDMIQLLTQSAYRFEFLVEHTEEDGHLEVALNLEDEQVSAEIGEKDEPWNRYSHAALLVLLYELGLLDNKVTYDHKKYTRKGMIKRVLEERKLKAQSAKYKIKWAANIHGDHILTNEKGVKYTVFLRDFDAKTGWSDSRDAQINKLGTTKHIMFAFQQLEKNQLLYKRLGKSFPFIEVFCDPLNEYRITWHFPHKMGSDEKAFITKYFGNDQFIHDDAEKQFLGFFQEAERFNRIRIRPEVGQRIEEAYEQEMLEQLREVDKPQFATIRMSLFPYQKEGVAFALYRKVAIIADEMGLGKTVQAIAAAVEKKRLFGFKKCLIVCPASLKEQWKKEIEKATDEKATVVEGFPDARALQYKDSGFFFCIANYEAILRDQVVINEAGFDFLILDEAQRIKNYETKTAASISRLAYRHVLVITGTPIENKLIDLFSLVSAINPKFFGPLWEFSYQHCLFDPVRHDKINGYYNLQSLNKRLESIMIRREKRKVISQLPHIQQITVPVKLSRLAADYHASYASGLAKILQKKYLTPFDLQRIQLLLTNMRMVCDSTFLIDESTNESPKMDELRHILLEQLNLRESHRKVIIFSEWVKMHKLIAKMLRENNIGFTELNGTIPVKHRGELIRRFEENPLCKVFLSTEAGGSGLNLQVADVLINFELPWNPAKKNQRAGRIDRLGQKSSQLTIFNMITRHSIEERIASGLLVKQSLFDGVMGEGEGLNYVDFSSKGRSQFIQQLEEFLAMGIQDEQPDESLQLSAPASLEMPMEEDYEFGSEDGAWIETEMEPSMTSSATPSEMSSEPPSETSLETPSATPTEVPAEPQPAASTHPGSLSEVEEVMNSGMQFLAGMFKMATGKEISMADKAIEVDKNTGEVVMRFKIPVG